MPNYRRWRVPGGTYFFTVTLHDRRRRLLTDHVDDLRDAFRTTRENHPFHIDAIVILPEHLHCVWTLPKGDVDYSMRWNLIKGAFSRSLPRTETPSKSRQRKRERSIWVRRFWEHTIGDEDDFAEHVDYIHYNPVKHGYVKRAIDWPHSSFHDYVKRGILDSAWGTSGVIKDLYGD
ncbi:MAG: transposase [Planctomycetota bacterium]|nr:transposase [Planctomycetota bacterium]